MKEMIKTLIADGWEWVAKNYGFTSVLLFKSKPCVELSSAGAFFETNVDCITIPECLFPQVDNKNSPVELKTLLLDAEKDEQKVIKDLIEEGCVFLVRDMNSIFGYDEEKEVVVRFDEIEILKKFCPKKFEKVPLKDLVKKRKVKKSVWLAVDKNGVIRIANEKPIRGDGGIWVDERGYAVHDMSKHPNLLPISWEDEPKQITIEVEE